MISFVRSKQEVNMERQRKKTSRRQSYERAGDKPVAITPAEYSGLQEAFDLFNKELFAGTLPDVFITYQRKAHSHGYFAPDRFSGRVGKFAKHELALNPDAFIDKSDKQICQSLVHEMHHVDQHANGKPSSRGYHNQEWAAKMKANGLQPSSTGMVGGKETGQHMLDYIIPGGAFDQSYERLAATGWKLNLQSAHRPGGKGRDPSHTKFICHHCQRHVRGKPSSAVLCMPCTIAALPDVKVDWRNFQMMPEGQSYETNQPEARTTGPGEWTRDKLMQYVGDINVANNDGTLALSEGDQYQLSKLKDCITHAMADHKDRVRITQEQADWLEHFVAQLEQPAKPKRGRPKGSKNKPTQSYDATPKRRGRPKGSKNKPKTADAVSYERAA
jgi:hypothetical protein